MKILLLVLLAYCAGWAGAFLLLVGSKIELVPSYFVWGWTGGGELPTFVQLFALACGLVAAILVLVARHRKNHCEQKTERELNP